MSCVSVFDAHCDTISRLNMTGESLMKNGGMVELCKTSGAFARYCQFFALFSNCANPNHSGYDSLRDCFYRQMQENSRVISPCRTAEDAVRANEQGKAAAFLTVEGAEILDCSLEKLEQAASDGVVAINLTWNHANAISGSNVEQSDRGLSGQGKRFVERMQELGILVDVSHLSDPGFWDVMEQAKKPVIASHSNARGVHFHTRNLTDEQITAIIKNHGIIGLNFYRDFIGLSLDFDAVRRHLDHILDLGGAKSVALGGDWDGCETIDQMPDITSLCDLHQYLCACGYDECLVEDLFYNNLMRVVRNK